MIRIVLVRHARPESAAVADDLGPPLSEEGRVTHRKITEELKKQGIAPTKIISSPLTRALQTAEIMSEVFDGVAVSSTEFLDGTFSIEDIVDGLERFKEGDTVFLVGHVPNMTLLANGLSPEKVTDGVEKSGCVIFDFSNQVALGQGTYVGYIHP